MSLTNSLAGGGQGPKGDTGATGAAGAAGATGPTGPSGATTSVLAGNATSTTATMAATGLSVPVTSGKRYAFRAILMLNDSSTSALAGSKFDFDASTATVSNFRAGTYDNGIGAFNSGAWFTALSADITNAGGPFIDALLIIEGGFEPSSTGTVAIRFAQNTVTDGALTIYRDSSLTIWENP